jgi:peptidoglycan/LPS O-acetylase OafA/YrhL
MREMHHNNFDFLRFVAAMLVWYSHGYLLVDSHDPLARPFPFETLGNLGISLFFIISGYFITASYERSNTALQFVINRALRVLPALLLVVAFGACIIGPLATTLSVKAYFAHPDTWKYLRSVFSLQVQPELPGVFQSLPVHAVNGSLSTLLPLAFCYGIIAIAGMLGILQQRVMMVICGACLLLLVYGAWCGTKPPEKLFDMRFEKLYFIAHLAFLFTGGALVYMMRGGIPRHVGILTGCVLIVLFSAGLPDKWGIILFDAALIYAVIYLGFLKIPLLQSIGKYGDFSYGFYLFAFPVQQFTLYMLGGEKSSFGTFMLLSFLVTLICSIVSWHLIERHALRFKR